jgi:hypothetical protein
MLIKVNLRDTSISTFTGLGQYKRLRDISTDRVNIRDEIGSIEHAMYYSEHSLTGQTPQCHWGRCGFKFRCSRKFNQSLYQ